MNILTYVKYLLSFVQRFKDKIVGRRCGSSGRAPPSLKP
jgi:hypothetical protein